VIVGDAEVRVCGAPAPSLGPLPPGMEHAPRPFWTHLLRLALWVLLWVAVYLFFGALFTLARMQTDFWPLDGGRVVPNITAGIAQVALATTFAFLFYKPASSWLRNKFHAHLGLALAHHREHLKEDRAAEHAELHERHDRIEKMLHHVILNTKNVPDEVPGLKPEHQPLAQRPADPEETP
jgi:hypothetical protein